MGADWGGPNREFIAVDFRAEPLSGEAPLTVTFTNPSTPTQALNGALWTFGDGATLVITGGLTAGMTHTHVYTRHGIFTVGLSAGDGVVTDTLTRAACITAKSYTTTTRVIGYSYDGLYRLTGAAYSTGRFETSEVFDAHARATPLVDFGSLWPCDAADWLRQLIGFSRLPKSLTLTPGQPLW